MPITPSELAERASVSDSYIQRLCRQGRIKAAKPGGRDWFIDEEEAEKFLRGRKKGHRETDNETN